MNLKFLNKDYNVKIWSITDGYIGKILSLDCETPMVESWTNTPELVTLQAYGGGSNVYYIPKDKIHLFLNKHRDSIIIGINLPFDVDVINKHLESNILFDWYDNNQVRDIGIMYRLLQLAVSGKVPFKYNLQLLTAKFLKADLIKDEVRENFGQFLNTPLNEIPEEYLTYGALDVIAPWLIYHKLLEYIEPHDRYKTLLSLDIQVKGDLALNAIYKNGIGFDIPMRDKWLDAKDLELIELSKRLADWGLQRGVAGYKSQFRYIVEDLLGLKVPYRYKKLLCRQTEQGNWIYAESGMIEVNKNVIRVEEGQSTHALPSISSQREDLEEFSDQSFIADFLEFQAIEKATSFVRDIESSRVHPRYSLLKNTGRTSCSKPNFQQLPKMGGIREMFKAKEGHTFIITDYSAVELATLSQVLYKQYGESVMRDQINNGVDLHKYYASVMHGCPVSSVNKQQRQEAKAANFGFPGGLGVKTFIQFSRGYDLNLTQGQAQAMKDTWFNAFPETREYMKNEEGFVFTLTGRKRGRTTYCAEKNTRFQGLAADGAKIALYNLLRRGFKVVGFVHDEIITEVSKREASDMLHAQEKIMIDAMKQVCPDVLIGVESAISEFYTK